MKHFLLFLSLSLPLAATAQKLEATSPPVTYHVGSERTPLYRSAADTVRAEKATYVPAGEEITVVGHFSPRWEVVKRTGFLFLTPSALVQSPNEPFKYAKLLDGTALPFDAQTHRITLQGVVDAPGASKEQLYSRALEWVAKSYKSAQAVIQMQDKESGKLVMKGLTKVSIRSYPGGTVTHTLSIYVKDGRYKYILTDLAHNASGDHNIVSGGPLEQPDGKVFLFGGDKKAWDGVRIQAKRDAELLVAGLQAAMTVPAGKDPSDF